MPKASTIRLYSIAKMISQSKPGEKIKPLTSFYRLPEVDNLAVKIKSGPKGLMMYSQFSGYMDEHSNNGTLSINGWLL